MKSRVLIIIGMIIAITISVSSLIIIDNIEDQSKFPPLRDDPNAPDELRVILQLCEKPWEDRGLNQKYRNQTHYLDTHNCVWKYNFDEIDWSDNPTKKFEETSLRLVLHACSSWIESKNGREPLAYSNETHFINTKNCELKIIEIGSFGMPLYENNRNELEQVLDWCNDTSNIKYGFYNYSNDTHSINTSTCEWKEHETYPNTDILCIPSIDKWVTGEKIRNQTHIFNKDSCIWKIDQDYDVVNSKGCPQFCPKDDKSFDNVFSIREKIEINGNRLEIFPSLKIMNFTNPVTVTFVNDSDNPVNIFDNARGKWSFKNVEPTDHRNLIINSTGYHKILVQDSRHGTQTTILVLSENTNSLPVEIRAKMAQIYLRTDSHRGDEIIGVGSGAAEPGITIHINEKFQDKYDDSEKFYYEKYRNMIPFDVPIMIEFHAPIMMQTG